MWIFDITELLITLTLCYGLYNKTTSKSGSLERQTLHNDKFSIVTK